MNFDDPVTYHLYYGDELGHPGSLLTFFPWPRGRRGRQGTGQPAPYPWLSLPHRWDSGSSEGLGTVVHLRRAPGFWRGADGVGTVHHVAFRAASEQT